MGALATGFGGRLNTLNDKCIITIDGFDINLKILPEISDSKSATYSDTPIIGRSFPVKTYAHSDNRVVTMKLHFLVVEKDDIKNNIDALFAIQSATYPREGQPYIPPPVCSINCGKMLGNEPLCAILQNYSVSYPTNVAWDQDSLIPYYFEVNCSFHIVYSTSGSNSLPNQDRIFREGR